MSVRAPSLPQLALAAAVLTAALDPARLAAAVPAASADEQFRAANEQARAGDLPKALAAYAAIASSGRESASLYWNWAQAASARGAQGEALWALLRARELDPGDRAVRREIERVREAQNLDPAEIAPEPLAAAARTARRFHLDVLALVLLLGSVVLHAGALVAGAPHGRLRSLGLFGLAALVAAVPLTGALARPTGAVVRRGAPLLEAATPTAEATGSLREGEVVPILEASGEWLRVEDNAGARGWAHVEDVRRLDRAPGARD